MSLFESLLEFVRQNLLQSLFILVVGVSVLRRALKQASEDQARRKAGGSLARPAADDDLREQVRRGFEEMMRQRQAAAAARAAAKSPAKAPAKPAKAVRTPPQVPSRAPAPAFDVALARTAAARVAALAKERPVVRRATSTAPSIARRLLGDRAAARRAFLLSEILDSPRSMRAGR